MLFPLFPKNLIGDKLIQQATAQQPAQPAQPTQPVQQEQKEAKRVGSGATITVQPLKSSVSTATPKQGLFSVDVEGVDIYEPPTFPLQTPPTDTVFGIQSQYETLEKQIRELYEEQIKSIGATVAEKEKERQKYQEGAQGALGRLEEIISSKGLSSFVSGALDEYKIRQNYFENQALLGELKMIMNEMNMSNMRAAELIRSGAISKTEYQRRQNELAARAGVLEAVLNARNNQIGTALNIIDRTYSAIKTELEMEVNYYKGIFDYFNQLRKETASYAFELSKEQRQYLNEKINLELKKLNQIEETANYIKEMMINPDKAMALANAGVSLLDDIQTINKKLSQWAYVKEVQNIVQQMAAKGYSEILTADELSLYSPEEIVKWRDSRGKVHYFVNPNALKTKVSYKDFIDNSGNITRVYTETDQYGNVIRTWIEKIGQYGKASSQSSGNAFSRIIETLEGRGAGATSQTPSAETETTKDNRGYLERFVDYFSRYFEKP